ncbi:MAG TPA: Stealth CR1 domain-containing protein [Rudaea sp.]|nr:Stealth CR1 domain-containing protein [Rudaea sp.]
MDAVIPWVDGNDPAHRERLESYLRGLGRPRSRNADPTRFDDAGELVYCVASIIRYAPWFRQIHIVTDRQTPALMSQLAGTPWAQRVRVVDHREIFADHEQHLPTFNSRSISCMLYRIPDLARHFVCFNDDFAVLRPIDPAVFFRGDSMVVRGQWCAQGPHQWHRRIATRLGIGGRARASDAAPNRLAQQFSARLAGFERNYCRMQHTPYPYRRTTIRDFFAEHPQRLETQLSHRLRSADQFLAESLAAHLEIAHDNAVIDNRLRVVQLKPAEQAGWRLRAKLRRADRDPSFAFACVQSLDLAPPAVRRDVVAWLDRRVGSLDVALAESGKPRAKR